MSTREARILEALHGGVEARLTLAVEFARPFACRPTTKRARTSELTPRPPAPLAFFFEALGTAEAVGQQDRLLAPRDRSLDGERLVFAEENQSVCSWACDLVGEDPPVYYRHHRAEAWADEHLSLSTFLLRFATVEALFGDAEAQSAPCLPADALESVLAHLRPLPFPDASWPEAPTRLYARDGVLSMVSPNGEGVSSIWVTAGSSEELSFLDGLIDEHWD